MSGHKRERAGGQANTDFPMHFACDVVYTWRFAVSLFSHQTQARRKTTKNCVGNWQLNSPLKLFAVDCFLALKFGAIKRADPTRFLHVLARLDA